MASLHIVNPRSGGHVFRGMFGDIVPSPAPGRHRLRLAPDLMHVSHLLSGTTLADGLDLDADEIVTIEAEPPILRALTATLARALEAQWNRGYATALGSVATPIGEAANLPVPKSLLQQAIHAEQAKAMQGIDALIQAIDGIAPYWVDVRLKHTWVGTDMQGIARHVGHPHAIELAEHPHPVRMVAAREDTHPRYSAQAQIAAQPTPALETGMPGTALVPIENPAAGELPEDGWFDLDAAFPLYLPNVPAALTAPAPVTSRAPTPPRLFHTLFGARPADPVAAAPAVAAGPATAADTPLDAVARQMVTLIMGTPLLKELIFADAVRLVPHYASRQVSAFNEPFDRDDEDDEGYDHERP